MTDSERAAGLYQLARAWLNWIEAYICADLPQCEALIEDLRPADIHAYVVPDPFTAAHSGASDGGAAS